MDAHKTKPKYICTIRQQDEIKFAQDALYVLSGKWRMPIIISLYNGLCRYREIARSIPGITFAMLSRELQIMELNNLVQRYEDPAFPKSVKYILTDYCQSLYPVIENLIDWGKGHRQALSGNPETILNSTHHSLPAKFTHGSAESDDKYCTL